VVSGPGASTQSAEEPYGAVRTLEVETGKLVDSPAIALVQWLSAMFTALEFFAGSGLVRLGLAAGTIQRFGADD